MESKNTIAQTVKDFGDKVSVLHTWISNYSGNKAIKVVNDDINLCRRIEKTKKR